MLRNGRNDIHYLAKIVFHVIDALTGAPPEYERPAQHRSRPIFRQ